MKLREWREREGYKQIAIADKLSCARDYFNSIECGRRKPGRKLIQRIIELTKGEVTFEDLC